MLNAINASHLSQQEWDGVRHVLHDVAGCGCAEPARPGSLRHRLGRMVDAVIGEAPPAPVDPRRRAVRDFICDSGRQRALAEDHVSSLTAHGFNRAQIEAIAMLGA